MRRSRSRSPGRRYRGRDHYDSRRRSPSPNCRDDDYHRRRDGGNHRARRRSRDRPRTRPRSPDRRRPRSRDRDGDRDSHGRRNRSRPRDRPAHDAPADSSHRSKPDDGRLRAESSRACDPEPAKPPPLTDEQKKAERLKRVEAWKQKMTKTEARNNIDATPASTRELLAEMDQEIRSPSLAHLTLSGGRLATSVPSTRPIVHAAEAVTLCTSLPSENAVADDVAAPRRLQFAQAVSKSLPTESSTTNRTNSKKMAVKRRFDFDHEDEPKRKLVKLPAMPLEQGQDTPPQSEAVGAGTDQDAARTHEEDDEEALTSADPAAQELLLRAVVPMDLDADEPHQDDSGALAAQDPTGQLTARDAMDVDDDADDLDPLDAFMANLSNPHARMTTTEAATHTAAASNRPELFFQDNDDFMSSTANNDDWRTLPSTASRKKDIPTVDWNKVDLEPVRKDIWVESQELSRLTADEVQELREQDGIKVVGKNVAKPISTWSQAALVQSILNAIAELKYDQLMPIQKQALPVIMSGRDVVAIAKTGSGKTMAFLLPMFRHIMSRARARDTCPTALILAPTRELVQQIHRNCTPFLKGLDLRAVAVFGGVPINQHIAELKRGTNILIATPGRLFDLLGSNKGRVTNLHEASYIVLDEADRMFDMGFESQVMRIFRNIRPDRQVVLFSATMPRVIDALAKKVLRDPVEITAGGRSVVPPTITQIVEVRNEPDKFNRLLGLLGDLFEDDGDIRALIFVDRQEKADQLLADLMRKGWGCMAIHGAIDQSDRASVIADFTSGVSPILIATSIAARGIDIAQLKLVVNYDAPNHREDYVHRVGRTGRAGGTGTAITFITEEQEDRASAIAIALEHSGQPVPERIEEMRKSHRAKVKAGKAKDNSGFGGKGLEKLDQDREAARLRERKTHKAEGEEDAPGDDETPSKMSKVDSAVQAATSTTVSRETIKKAAIEAKTVKLAAVAAATTTTGRKDTSTNAKGGAMDKASAAVDAINARLSKAGQLRVGQQRLENKGPDAGAFQATLEINDFPQKARWAVTNRTNVAKILEATGTSITTKGIFYSPGAEPPPGGEPKLYILIEGDTQVVVEDALAEMTRMLKEAMVAAADAENRAPTGGRYKVT